jgi:hypothetical protein
MPGAVIKQHLAVCTEDAFNEVAQVFRHDFVLYAGMLQSWMTLFEAEVPGTQPVFARMTRHLMEASQQFLEESKPRLYPHYVPPAGDPQPEHIWAWWDRFYTDCRAYVHPRLFRLEAYMRTYIARPEFQQLQETLGPAAGNERIDKMLLSAYHKLQALFDAEQFDRRVAAVLENRQQAARAG